MTDLSHWDFAEQFTVKESAELIIGIPPEINNQVMHLSREPGFAARITPVLRRMKGAYASALSKLNEAIASDFELGEPEPQDLQSELMISIRVSVNPPSDPRKKLELMVFEKSFFHRDEIQRWLNAIGMQSTYKFDRTQSQPSGNSSRRWPWGNHHTELLEHLNVAAQRYWGERYDPTDATTAPINSMVSEWLQKERKISRTMADAIASILRPDGLPTGPRK
jgi:hypothetical protein